MQDFHSRRDFIRLSLLGFGTAVLSSGLTACFDVLSRDVTFVHGVASGDPLSDRVILWTRVTPSQESTSGPVRIAWEVALDPDFNQLVNSGSAETSDLRDYTIKVDAAGLLPGTVYFFRFRSADHISPVGRTRTLPDHGVAQVNLAVVSCSNYAAGRFHVYREVASRQNLDAVLHLGDYIYEHGRGEYASEKAAELGREVLPEFEILTLQDYRARYAQYRRDPDLQAAHQQHPFIAVWDDHEVANNTWREGAGNHQDHEGPFELRRLHALQAYAEWMPLRPLNEENRDIIYRSFQFGQLVTLHMLDTRVIARDRPLEHQNYFTANGFESESFLTDMNQSDRTMLGVEQREWLMQNLQEGTGVWQVLGQQVLMSRMYLPGAIATQRIGFSGFARLAQLAAREAQGMVLSSEDQTFLDSQRALLKLPPLPINLDAWDGFAVERELLLSTAHAAGLNLLVLAGDSHNAWASQLKNANGDICGVELATASVSSPGLEKILKLSPEAFAPTEKALMAQIKDLKYANISDRGYLVLGFTEEKVNAEFIFVDSVFQENYRILNERGAILNVQAGTHELSRA